MTSGFNFVVTFCLSILSTSFFLIVETWVWKNILASFEKAATECLADVVHLSAWIRDRVNAVGAESMGSNPKPLRIGVLMTRASVRFELIQGAGLGYVYIGGLTGYSQNQGESWLNLFGWPGRVQTIDLILNPVCFWGSWKWQLRASTAGFKGAVTSF